MGSQTDIGLNPSAAPHCGAWAISPAFFEPVYGYKKGTTPCSAKLLGEGRPWVYSGHRQALAGTYPPGSLRPCLWGASLIVCCGCRDGGDWSLLPGAEGRQGAPGLGRPRSCHPQHEGCPEQDLEPTASTTGRRVLGTLWGLRGHAQQWPVCKPPFVTGTCIPRVLTVWQAQG